MINALAEITAEDLLAMPADMQQEVLNQIKQVREYVRYNKLHFYKPFPFQRDFIRAGKEYKTRFLRAGNRCGKSYSACAELAMHLTGEYPPDWEGEVVEGSGHLFWIIGITINSCMNVLGKELFGTNDCRDKINMGSGMIPKRCIEFKDGFQPDGAVLRQCLIKHTPTGGHNTLALWGSENEAVLMGARVRYVLMDEENPYTSMQIYSQCQTRLLNAAGPGNNGSMVITATPEGGLTPLNALFERNEGNKLYLQQASMDDNPTLSEEQIEEFLSKIPVWQRAMRRHGLPVLGDHAVFQYSDDEITESNYHPLPHWRAVWSIDAGEITDPSVLILSLYDPDNDKYYIHQEHYLDQSVEARSPRTIANIILNSEYRAVPLITPHDMGINSADPQARAKQLSRLGVNVYMMPFQNPAETQLAIQYTGYGNNSTKKIATGINEMCFMFEEGILKVNPTCFNWMKEKHGYYVKVNKNTGTVSFAGADHAIDSSRYGIMTLRRGLGCLWSERGDIDSTQLQGFDTIQFN